MEQVKQGLHKKIEAQKVAHAVVFAAELRSVRAEVDRELQRASISFQDEVLALKEAHAVEVQSARQEAAEKLQGAKEAADAAAEALEEKRWQAVREATELWRAPAVPGRVQLSDSSAAVAARVAAVFKALSHRDEVHFGQPSRCSEFQRLRILCVQGVHNPGLWQQYSTNRAQMETAIRHDKTVSPVSLPSDRSLISLLPGCKLRDDLNECIFVHGCTGDAARSILKEGFDIRRTRTHGGSRYGEGVYFAAEPCKSHQYTHASGAGPRHMFVARVLLGSVAFVRGSYQGRLPPLVDCGDESKGRVDSLVVDPGRCSNSHWEFVVFKGEQAYPEMLVTYELC